MAKKIVYWSDRVVQWGRVFEFHFSGYIKGYFKRRGVRYAKIQTIDTVSDLLEIPVYRLRKKCSCKECK